MVLVTPGRSVPAGRQAEEEGREPSHPTHSPFKPRRTAPAGGGGDGGGGESGGDGARAAGADPAPAPASAPAGGGGGKRPVPASRSSKTWMQGFGPFYSSRLVAKATGLVLF